MGRILTFLITLFSTINLLHPRVGRIKAAIWLPKLLAGGLSPFLTFASVIGALMGLKRRDQKAVFAGLLGAGVAAWHIRSVRAPHAAYESVFGPDWGDRISTQLHSRMLTSRWMPYGVHPPRVPWKKDLRIDTHHETGDPLLADLWEPQADETRTGLGIIYLHGSGWHYGDKDMATRHFFRHLTSQGHVILDVAYTLAPKARLHAMLADVKRSIAWMKTQGVDYDINPTRIVMMGGSSGGHLALLAAYTPNHPELQPADVKTDTSVRAVVSYYGPTDLISQQKYLKGLLQLTGETQLQQTFISYLEKIPSEPYIDPATLLPNLIGGTPEELPELYRLGSPIHHIGSHCPPTLQLVGSHDLGGMKPDMQRLHQALREAGVLSVYIEYPYTDHGFDLIFPRWSPAAQAATFDTERFLALMI